MSLLFAIPTLLLAVHSTDLSGKTVPLFEGGRPTVLVFIRSDCPISNRYAPELERLYQEYSGRAAFYLVYADRVETAEGIQKHMSEYGLTFDALRDPQHELVKLAKAHVTPEAAVFSGKGDLLYHGRIDDRYLDFGKYRPQPTVHDLDDALRAVVAGKPVKVSSTRAIGCFLADIE